MQKDNHISDIIKIKSFLENQDRANQIIGINLLSSIGIIPEELIDCITYGMSKYKRTITIDIIENKDYEIHISMHQILAPQHIDALEHIYKIKNLVSFFLYCPQIIIPNSFKKIKNLRKISFGSIPNNVGKEEYIFSIISSLEKLEQLSLFNQGFNYIPSSIGKLVKLKKLYLSKNNLTTLPESITNLKELKSLGINDCNFEKLPPAIFNLTQLEDLDISNLPLKKFPSELLQFKKLKTLIIRKHNWEVLPEEILYLDKLKVLDISHSKFKQFPKIIFYMDNLKKLKIGMWQFSKEEEERIKNGFGKRLEINVL